jgi:uncharacterized membrane protein
MRGQNVSTAHELKIRMRIPLGKKGQVLLLAAVCMMVLTGFMGLAIDLGVSFRNKRNMQIAADAAATAGALDYYYHQSSTSATSAATAAAAQNGVNNGSGGAVVTVRQCS